MWRLPRVHADGRPECLAHQADCLPHQVSALAAGASVALLLVPTHDLRRPHASAHASAAAAKGGNQPDEGGNQAGHHQDRQLLAQPAPLPRPLMLRTDNIGVVQVGF